MISFFSKVLTTAVLLGIVAFALPAMGAGIGFQAGLDLPVSAVSPFEEDNDMFSVALHPRYKILLTERLRRRPMATYASTDELAVRLELEYFTVRDYHAKLVPVSVDARLYAAYRVQRMVDRGFLEGGYRTMTDPERRGRGGLGISVGLPKRLDRIFGEGGAGLKVAGFRRITFAGRSQWSDDAASETYRPNKFPALRMEQVSRFDITGTIGSKISVKVSQDSQTDIPLANRIQIRYRGDDDDILKSIEAGNTTLSLPNTQFVGYSSRIQGLFGLKAEAQIGHLNLTAIASQEKGATERSSFSATGEENADDMRETDYADRRVFDLCQRNELKSADKIIQLFVFKSIVASDQEPEARPANIWVDPNNRGAYPGEDQESKGALEVIRLETNEYVYVDDADRNLHYVVFNRSQDYNRILGYYMEVESGTDTIAFGDISVDSLYELRLLAPTRDDAEPTHQTWEMMWRNCYPITKGIGIDDINIKIFKGEPGTEKTSGNLDYQLNEDETPGDDYTVITGLDIVDLNENGVPDGLLDGYANVFRPEWGLLMFRDRHPFNPDSTFTLLDNVKTSELADPVPEIYEKKYKEIAKYSKYYIRVITKTRSTIINLGRANIIEGSESVTINGDRMARGTDYEIIYDIGKITLLNELATDPNADISIDYEYAPFFAVQKKTLLGARAEYEWSPDFQLGSTVLYKSDKTQERKPKVGQETAKMVVLDGDMSLKLHPNFLTSVVDAIPLVESEAPSNIAITAEVAQSHPNPNVNDVAWVDDFESAQDELSLGTIRTRWTKSSEPWPLEDEGYERGRLLWHNPREGRLVEDIYDRDAAQGEGSVRTLRFVYRPTNYIDSSGVQSWAGVMRYFGSAVDETRTQLFEVRMKKYGHPTSKLHFDFGRITEDVNGDNIAFSEDTNSNYAVQSYEDVGLDGLDDSREGTVENPYDPVTNPDPAGDNYYFLGAGDCPVPYGCNSIDWESDEWYYEYLNGTEGNRDDQAVSGLPDQEALSRTGFKSLNSYYSFELDLATDSFMVENSEKNGWVTYRIPIREEDAVDRVVDADAMPSWNSVTHVRVWFESEASQYAPDTVEIADWYFVQSNWQDSLILRPDSLTSTTRFVVAEISEDENADFVPPPGVEAYTDPTTNVTEAQRALLMNFETLSHGDTCLATKDLLSVDQYAGYRRMQMFVYGDYAEAADEGYIQFFFRIGTDATNYYEYYTDIYQGWDDRNAVNIDFNEMTALKDSALKVASNDDYAFGDDGKHYRVLGTPDITRVRYFAAGLINNHPDTSHEITGQLWLDELRVTDVRRDIGTAGRVTVTGNFSDLINYSATFESRDPYFRGLSEATRGGSSNNLGSGETKTTQSYRATLNLNKFLPPSWGARIPASVSYDKTTVTPLLRTNSDIVLPEDVRKEEQTVSEGRGMTVSTAFNRRGRNPLFSLLLNRLKTQTSYRRTTQHTVTTPYTFGENYNVRSNFDFGIKEVPTARIFFWTKPIPFLKRLQNSRLGLYPDKWTTTSTFSRTLTIREDASAKIRTTNQRTFVGNMDMSYRVFDNLRTTYNYNTNRDITDPDLIRWSLKDPKLGLETSLRENFSATYDPKLLSFFKTSFSIKTSYTEDWLRQYSARKSAMSRTAGVSGQFDHKTFLPKSSGRRKTTYKKKKVEKPPVYAPVVEGLKALGDWIDPISYSYNETYNNSLPGMTDRPSWQYRWGFRDEAGVDDDPGVVGNRSTTNQKRYDLSSGFILLGGLTTKVKYAEAITTDLHTQGARNESKSTNWPELNIRIQKFKHFPVIKEVLNKFIDVFAPRTGYSRQVKESRNLDAGFLNSRTVTKDFRPLLAISFKLFRAMSLSASYNLDETSKKTHNPTTGEFQSETITTRKSLSMTSKYSFSSPKGIALPVFGRMKFNSTVDIELTVRMNSNVQETAQAGEAFVPQSDKSEFMFSPVVSYTFSRQMKGGLTLRWQDVNDNHRDRKNHTREVQIWTEISF